MVWSFPCQPEYTGRLRRHTSIDALVKGTSRRVDGEILVVLFEHLDVIVGDSFNFVNVLDGVVGTVARNLSRGVGEHARKVHIIALMVVGCIC